MADESSVASTAPRTPPLPENPPGPLDRVRQFIDAWLADWQRRDIDAYLAHYVENYDSPSHESHDAWLAQRRSSIGNARDISIRYEDLELVAQAPDDNAAPLVVRFRMHYEASNYADYTWKELALRDTEDGLRISLERNLEVQPLD